MSIQPPTGAAVAARTTLHTGDLEGKVALVTGAGSGIGHAIAVAFGRAGAHVVVNYFGYEQQAEALAQALTRSADRSLALKADVSNAQQVADMVRDAVKELGPINILVNNAGVESPSPFLEIQEEDWDRMVNIDLKGAFLCAQACGRVMKDNGGGSIVNISSIAGKEGNPNASPYSAAKSGVIGLTKSLAKEVATKGVIINGITPAVIATDILKQVSEEHITYMTSRIPMGRVGQPEEVAALAAFLASGEVTFSTGAIFDLSGGRATY